MNNNNNICRNCKHFRPNNTWTPMNNNIKYGICMYPTHSTTDVVTGRVSYEKAEAMRSDPDACGVQGVWYEMERNDAKRIERELRQNSMAPFGLVLVTWIAIIILASFKAHDVQ